MSSCSGPFQRELRTPGMPPSASTQMPESSASAGSPEWTIPSRALMRALPSKVHSDSSGSG